MSPLSKGYFQLIFQATPYCSFNKVLNSYRKVKNIILFNTTVEKIKKVTQNTWRNIQTKLCSQICLSAVGDDRQNIFGDLEK